MMKIRLGLGRTVGLLIAAVLTACSSGGGASQAPALSAAHASTTATATLKIMVPQKTASAATARKPAYVSPATQSIAISFTPTVGSPQTFNQNLTPASNPNCTASLISPEVCTVTFALAPGNYTATFATYDGLLDGSSNPTGNMLSQNQSVPVTIGAGQANSINVTLQGVPTSVALIPGITSTITGSQSAGYGLSKCFANQSVSVIGLDADGNYILGPGAPTPSLTSSDTTQLAVTTPTTAAPNTFIFTRPGIPTANASITLTPTVTPGTGGGSATSASIALTFDATICGTFTAYGVPTGSSSPWGIASGRDGALWFTEYNGNNIGRISTSGAITEYLVGAGPQGIASGPDGALWFTEYNGNNIGRISTSGAITEYAVPTLNSSPVSIASGPDGALWFTEQSANNIGRISTSGAITEYAVPTPFSNPQGIASGPDGALWFTEYYSNNIGRISTSGAITEYSITTNSYPVGIASGPDGALWFTENGGNNIGRLQ
jgi:virginiamycin B lyase